MSEEPKLSDEFQYHSGELDLAGESADHHWSIR